MRTAELVFIALSFASGLVSVWLAVGDVLSTITHLKSHGGVFYIDGGGPDDAPMIAAATRHKNRQIALTVALAVGVLSGSVAGFLGWFDH